MLTVGFANLAIPTFPVEIEDLPALSPGNLPAGTFPVLIGCATRINTFGATQKVPAGDFATPEISHFSLSFDYCAQAKKSATPGTSSL